MLHASNARQTLVASGTTARYPLYMSRWFEKTGWPVYLEGKDLRAVGRLLACPIVSKPGLRALLQAFDKSINKAQQLILDEEVNILAL